MQSTLAYLAQHGVKPSQQRLAVMNYLLTHRTHPTVEEVYQSLITELPTLSRTTVYNTLRLLAEHGAALQLTIDEKKVCYDGDTSPHAHFLCTRCGKVFDVPLRCADVAADGCLPSGFKTDDVQLYYRGCCPQCNQPR